ncbi:MAG: zinc-binding dehydrogenase [Bacteroidota bacterium]
MSIQRQSYCLKAGNISNLKLVEATLPDPEPGQVTVANRALGLNFADIFAMFGLYSATPKGVFTPGLEYAGVIEKVGPGVNSVKPGDRVMGVTRFGAYTSHLNIEQEYVIPIPPDWSFAEGAAYLVQVLTAYYGLIYLGRLEKEETVLIHSAAGGVGILANRIAKKYGAFTIGSVGNSSKVDFCKKEGYNEVIVRSNNFAADLKKSLGDRELNVVMECIGGKIFKAGFAQMAAQGRMVIYGAAQYASPGKRPNYLKVIYQYLTRPRIDAQDLAEVNKMVSGFNLIYLYEKKELLHQLLGEIKDLNIAKPHVGHTFPFTELLDAVRLFQTGQTIGKVVIER